MESFLFSPALWVLWTVSWGLLSKSRVTQVSCDEPPPPADSCGGFQISEGKVSSFSWKCQASMDWRWSWPFYCQDVPQPNGRLLKNVVPYRPGGWGMFRIYRDTAWCWGSLVTIPFACLRNPSSMLYAVQELRTWRLLSTLDSSVWLFMSAGATDWWGWLF